MKPRKFLYVKNGNKKISRLKREAEKLGRIDYQEAKQKTLDYVAKEFDKYKPHFENANGLLVNFKLQIVTSRGIIHDVHPRHFKEYQAWRIAVFEKDNYSCQHCGSNENLQAHHIKQYAFYPDLRLDIKNGLTLCRTCHKKIPVNYRKKDE